MNSWTAPAVPNDQRVKTVEMVQRDPFTICCFWGHKHSGLHRNADKSLCRWMMATNTQIQIQEGLTWQWHHHHHLAPEWSDTMWHSMHYRTSSNLLSFHRQLALRGAQTEDLRGSSPHCQQTAHVAPSRRLSVYILPTLLVVMVKKCMVQLRAYVWTQYIEDCIMYFCDSSPQLCITRCWVGI